MAHSSFKPPQNVAVVLEINGGSFDDGFSVTLRILEDGRIIKEDRNLLSLPAAPEMPRLYQEWQKISLIGSRKLQAVPAQETNVADLEKWQESAKRLEQYCRNWFQEQQTFGRLSDRIQGNKRVVYDQSVPIIIQCSIPNQLQRKQGVTQLQSPTENSNPNEVLRRLPWHFWDLFSHLPHAEPVVFSGFNEQVSPLKLPVKILAIFGSSHGGLNLTSDQKSLELLAKRGGEITLVSQPDLTQLSNLLFDHDWDIFFFAGHSSSEGESCTIQINDSVCLPLDALRHNFGRVIRNGLKLAIFNSCDGLGIADFLTNLGLPNVIVMREPVPDIIARQFLFYFLEQFSQGIPLFLAVRQARDRLESIQASTFPAASWLPVVCINPSQAELVWPQLSLPEPTLNSTPTLPPQKSSSQNKRYLMIGLAAVVGFVAVAYGVMMSQNKSSHSHAPVPVAAEENVNISVGDRPITASRVKLSQPYLSFKQQGMENFALGKYESAVVLFEQLRNLAQNNRDISALSQAALAALQDPEVLIYRNNAFVRHRHSQNKSFPIYTIAVAAPLNENAGMDILFGVAQAQDVAVKQGINLEVVIANDRNTREQARRIAKILYDKEEVLAVIGHYTSPNTCAALNAYSSQPNPLVVISPTSSLVNLESIPQCGGNPSKVFFRTVSSSRVEAQSLVEYLVKDLQKSQPKVVAFYNKKESFSADLLQQFETVLPAFNGSIIAKYDLSDPNFNIKQLPPEVSNADALAVLADGGTDNNEAFQKAIEMIKLNNGKKPVLGANPLYLQKVIDQAQEATVNSLFMAVDWHHKQCSARDFAQQINKYWGGNLNRRTALAYEAVQAILQGIKPSGVSVTRQNIRQKLANTGIIPGEAASSATNKGQLISFDARGDRKEITTRAIVTVNRNLQFDLVKDDSCPNPQ